MSNDPYLLGFEAYQNGLDFYDANPYDIRSESKEHGQWEHGYLDAEDDAHASDDSVDEAQEWHDYDPDC